MLAGTIPVAGADAQGVATTCRAFTPVNASGEKDADGIDYGTEAQNHGSTTSGMHHPW